MVRYYCDRCGKDITADNKYRIMGQIITNNDLFPYDKIERIEKCICKKCFDSFRLFVSGFALEDEIEEDEETDNLDIWLGEDGCL